ncbi:uncharacterized protein FIBRA_05737 [Fibroporia radiculosa]|uniref:Uncharacterized protein n=1 Tax=Fibroporia radiculosa TaxID=599839 RepID=J4H3P4_9APHY|nr:uncharacterized protein FIBRA_05737 [Fibroporia radiculosa]CCM03599.1 predicted protein [Fibroporia radiculosa]
MACGRARAYACVIPSDSGQHTRTPHEGATETRSSNASLRLHASTGPTILACVTPTLSSPLSEATYSTISSSLSPYPVSSPSPPPTTTPPCTAAMNWSDIFEFDMVRSRSPSPPFSQIEREFCSNFYCCGLTIADLHELLDHFEEFHVIVLDQDGRPLDRSQDSDSATHGCTSIVLSYPQPDPPPTPDPDVLTAVLDVLDPDAFVAGLVSSGSSEPPSEPSSPAAETSACIPTCVPPSLLSVRPPAVKSDSARVPITHSENTRSRPPKPAPGGFDRTHGKAKAQVLGTAHTHAPTTKKRVREKTYKCPVRLLLAPPFVV